MSTSFLFFFFSFFTKGFLFLLFLWASSDIKDKGWYSRKVTNFSEWQCFHFQGIFLVLVKSKEFFKEFQKFKEFQGNLRKEKEIIQKFREFKEISVKCKENESNSRKITIPEALARVFHLSMSLLMKRTIKEHKFEEKLYFSSARSHILIFYRIKFRRQDFEPYHY